MALNTQGSSKSTIRESCSKEFSKFGAGSVSAVCAPDTVGLLGYARSHIRLVDSLTAAIGTGLFIFIKRGFLGKCFN